MYINKPKGNEDQNFNLDPEKFKEFSEICKHIVAESNVPICNGNGVKDTKPVFTDSKVCFNGCEQDAHETFYVERNNAQPEWRKGDPQHFSFCKTARKPYDVVVVACLIALSSVFGSRVEISSDGGEEAFDDDQANKLFTKAVSIVRA